MKSIMIGFYHLDVMIRTNKRQQMDKTGHCSCKSADTQEDMSPCFTWLRAIMVTDTDVGRMIVMMMIR